MQVAMFLTVSSLNSSLAATAALVLIHLSARDVYVFEAHVHHGTGMRKQELYCGGSLMK